MNNSMKLMLIAGLTIQVMSACKRELAETTPLPDQQQNQVDEKVAMQEANTLMAAAAQNFSRVPDDARALITKNDNVFYPGVLAISFKSPQPTVKLPLYKGIGPDDKPVYFIITEAANFNVARLIGVNYSPKLINGRNTAGAQEVTIKNGMIKFKGNVDFSPVRQVQPGPYPMTFPPSITKPGAIGDAEYSPVIVLPGGQVLAASMVANSTGTHDHLVNIDYDKGTVVMEMLDGFQGGKEFFYHLVTEASDKGAATIERGTYTPKLAYLPAFGKDELGDKSALLGFAPLANGETGIGNPNRQGLNSTILDGNQADPINVFPLDPNNNKRYDNNYSPMWDAHIYMWTDEAIAAGKRTRVKSLEQLTQLVNDGLVTDIPTNYGDPNSFVAGLKPSHVIINCPVIAQPFTAPENP